MSRRPRATDYTPAEDVRLRQVYETTTPLRLVLWKFPGRSQQSLYSRAYYLGLSHHVAPNKLPTDYVAKVRDLVADGLSSTAIAKLLGVTRNAVIGLASRRGWVWARKSTRPVRPAPLTVHDAADRLVPGACRWLEGEAKEFRYCGVPVLDGGSWCADHRQKVFLS